MALPAATPRVARSAPDALPWVAAAAYAALYFALGAVRYAAHTNFVDMGIFSQTAASAFGCFCNTIEGSHWAYHFSPVLYVAGALMQIWRSPLALVALQSVAGALTIPPVYAVVKNHAGVPAARLAAAVVWLYPPLAGVVFNDFHENGLAPAAIAWMLWAFDAGLPVQTLIFAALAVSVKEDQALFVAIAGAIGAFAYRNDALRLRLAAACGILGVAVFVVFFAWIQPHAVSAQTWAPVRFYSWSPQDWRALVPGGILQRIGFLLLAFVPLLFLPLRTWSALLLLAPLGEVLASRMPTTYTMGSHYAGAWAGWALFAFAIATGSLAARAPHRAHRALYWCIALCVVEFAAADPLHPGFFLHARTIRDARLDAFLATLPPRIAVATQEEAYTHLAATDPNATLLPETSSANVTSCHILTDSDFPDSPRLQEALPLVRQLVSSGAYRLQRRDGGITLYTKSAACP